MVGSTLYMNPMFRQTTLDHSLPQLSQSFYSSSESSWLIASKVNVSWGQSFKVSKLDLGSSWLMSLLGKEVITWKLKWWEFSLTGTWVFLPYTALAWIPHFWGRAAESPGCLMLGTSSVTELRAPGTGYWREVSHSPLLARGVNWRLPGSVPGRLLLQQLL